MARLGRRFRRQRESVLVFYSADLAERLDPAVALYGYVLEALKIKPMFDL
jgi:hypothetical protein